MATHKLIIVSCDTNSYPAMHFHGYIDNREDFEKYLTENNIDFLDIDWENIRPVDTFKIQTLLNEQDSVEYLIRVV